MKATARARLSGRSVVMWCLPFVYSACCCGPACVAGPLFQSYITGDDGAGPVIFRAIFDPTVPLSASLSVAVRETTPGIRLDNIDFTPGTNFQVVHATAQGTGFGALTHYNAALGTKLTPDLIPNTNTVTSPPASGVSRPASVLPHSNRIYYVENQFGFTGGTHRIMSSPQGGALAGPVAVAFDGGAGGAGSLVNFSGLEIVGGRLYFFARGPTDAADTRALYSIGLTGGVWNGAAPTKHIGGLFEGLAPGVGPGASDGSDELDFDPSNGLIFGTNHLNGEMIAFNPSTGLEVSSFGSTHFIDGADVAAGSPTGLGLLLRGIDGVRPTGLGNLVVVGHAGAIVSIDIDNVLTDGPDNADVFALFDNPAIEFDDNTLLAPVPEPSTLILGGVLCVGALGYGAWRRRANRA